MKRLGLALAVIACAACFVGTVFALSARMPRPVMATLVADDTLNNADKAFAEKKYAEAADLYQKALERDAGSRLAHVATRLFLCLAESASHERFDKLRSAYPKVEEKFDDEARAAFHRMFADYYARREHNYWFEKDGPRVYSAERAKIAPEDKRTWFYHDNTRPDVAAAFAHSQKALDLLTALAPKAPADSRKQAWLNLLAATLDYCDLCELNDRINGPYTINQACFFGPDSRGARVEEPEEVPTEEPVEEDEDTPAAPKAPEGPSAPSDEPFTQRGYYFEPNYPNMPAINANFLLAERMARDLGDANLEALVVYRRASLCITAGLYGDAALNAKLTNWREPAIGAPNALLDPRPHLKRITGEFAKSEFADEARFLLGYVAYYLNDFATARAEFAALQKDAPKSKYIGEARRLLDVIEFPQCFTTLSSEDVFLAPGADAHVSIYCRNVERVTLTLRELDLGALLNGADPGEGLFTELAALDKLPGFEKALGRAVLEQAFTPDASRRHFYTAMDDMPLYTSRPGAYLLEVKAGPITERKLIQVADLALSRRRDSVREQFWLTSRNGHALEGAFVRGSYIENILLYVPYRAQEPVDPRDPSRGTHEVVRHKDERRLITHAFSGRSDARGLIACEIPERGVSNLWAAVTLGGITFFVNDRDEPMAVEERAPWEPAPEAAKPRDWRCFIYSDRPVYRPGDLCRLRVMGRSTTRAVKGERVGVLLRAEGVEQFRGEVALNEFGAATLEFTVPPGAPLANWEILAVNERIDGPARFTLKVLEYVKRDIALKIDAPEETLAPGSNVEVPVTLSFLSGGAVADAAVNYTVTASAMGGGSISAVSGSGTTNADGQVFIAINTGAISAALEGRAVTLSFSAEAIGPGGQRVTATARAAISGKGVTVGAKWPEANWLEGRELQVELNVRDAQGQALTVDGTIRYYQVLGVTGLRPANWRTPALRLASEQPFHSPPGASMRLAAPGGGRWRIELEGRLEGESVRVSRDFFFTHNAQLADATFEVVPEFDSSDCSRPMRVLLANPGGGSVLAGMFINGQGGEERVLAGLPPLSIQAIEVAERHAPWVNVDLRRVRHAKLERAHCGLRVEPLSRRVNVKVNFDKERYLPGETASADIYAFNHRGEPVSAEVCLSVWDTALKEFAQSALDGKDLFAHFCAALNAAGVAAADELISERTRVAPSRKSDASVTRWRVNEMPRGSFFYGALSWTSTRQTSFAALYGGTENGEGGPALYFEDAHITESDDHNEDPTDAPKANDPYYGPSSSALGGGVGGGGGRGGKGGFAYRRARGGGGRAGDGDAAKVRENFKDSAFFGTVRTNEEGVAQVQFTLPDNLTDWTFEATATDKAAGVGQASGSFTVSKLLMVRFVGPRGLTEGDTVTLAALVQNQSGDHLQDVSVKLELNTDPSCAAKLSLTGAGATASVNLAPGASQTVSFSVQVNGYGQAALALSAEAGELKDSLIWKYAVEPRGVQVVSVQRFEFTAGQSQLELSPELPAGMIADKSSLVVQMDSGLLASCIDALPHLVNYPYGCVEQTMNRFVPLLDALDLLRTHGLSLYDISKQRSQYGGAATGGWPEDLADRAKVQAMLSEGFGRLRHYQHRDGGWGWWENDESQLHNSAVVLAGLARAHVLTRQGGELGLPVSDAAFEHMLLRAVRYVLAASAQENDHGLRNRGLLSAAQAISLLPRGTKQAPHPADELREQLAKLLRTAQTRDGAISVATLVLAQFHFGNTRDAKPLLRSLVKLGEDDGEGGIVFSGGEEHSRWHASPLEAQGFALEAIALVEPENAALPKALRSLIARRVDGWWGDTRSTGVAVAAIARYLKAKGEDGAEVSVDIGFGNAGLGTFVRSKQTPIAQRSRFELSGNALSQNIQGKLRLSRKGSAPVSGTCTVRGLVPLDANTGAVDNGLSISREYFKRVGVTREVHVEVQNQRGQVIRRFKEMRTQYEDVPLEPGETLKVGDMVTVRLTLSHASGRRYIAISDPRPACLEPISEEVKGVTREDRDARTLFFVTKVDDDQLVLSYSAVVTCTGKFTALPALAFDMYAEDTWGRSAPEQIGK